MKQYQQQFLSFAIKTQALSFGEFTLKSGRISPYFFNAGVFNYSQALCQIGLAYAQTMIEHELIPDCLFGPAYKGIPLVCATAIQLQTLFMRNVGYTFNRKEAKQHGEGGSLVGHPLKGNIVIIDDVITVGTAIYQAINLINQAEKAKLSGIIIALDRQEKNQDGIFTIDAICEKYNIPVIAILTLDNLLEYAIEHQPLEVINKINQYKDKYCV